MARNLTDFPEANWLDSWEYGDRFDIGEDYPVYFCNQCGTEINDGQRDDGGCEDCETGIFSETLDQE